MSHLQMFRCTSGLVQIGLAEPRVPRAEIGVAFCRKATVTGLELAGQGTEIATGLVARLRHGLAIPTGLNPKRGVRATRAFVRPRFPSERGPI